MGAGMFFIAILGCGDGSGACTQVAALPARYESRAQCAAETGLALNANSDFDFPTLVAECRAAVTPSAQRTAPPIPAGARNG